MKKSGIGSGCLLAILVMACVSLAVLTDWPVGLGNRCNAHAAGEEGTLKWKFQTAGGVASSPAIGSYGTIYVGSWDRYFYAINPEGTMKWKFEAGLYVESSPAIGPDGTIYVYSGNRSYGNLYAINSSSMGLANSPWPMFHRNQTHTGRAAHFTADLLGSWPGQGSPASTGPG
jgi:hypothetical protein